MSKRRSRRYKKRSLELNLTPLIDTALTLLVIFMIATPSITRSLKISLPSGETGEKAAEQTQPVVITCDQAGELYLNKQKITGDSLLQELKNIQETSRADKKNRYISSENSQISVLLRADRACSYGDIAELFDRVRSTGITRIGLVQMGPKNTGHR